MPLGGAKVDISRSFEYFDEDQRFSGGKILDLMRIKVRSKSERGPEKAYVVTISNWEHRGITGLKVESPCRGATSECGRPSMSGNDVKPF